MKNTAAKSKIAAKKVLGHSNHTCKRLNCIKS